MSNQSSAERKAAMLKYGGVGVLLVVAFGLILWQSLIKDLTKPSLPKEVTIQPMLESAALRAVMGMNTKQGALSSIGEIAPDPEGKPGTLDGWGTEFVLSMQPIAQSQHMTMSITSAGPDKQIGTADDITLQGVIEYIPQYKEYSLRSTEIKTPE